MPEHAAILTLAVPCRTDEPALARTLAVAHAAVGGLGLGLGQAVDLLVCINGSDAASSAALRDVRTFAREARAPLAEVAVDGAGPAPLSPGVAPLAVAALLVGRAGKPLAWNVLRQQARGPIAIFFDADVWFAPDAFRLLRDALAAAPEAALASGKTTCAPRPRAFERIMAAPYGVDFPNLSAQLYAARLGALPAAMPEDLIEPERWLELVVGGERLVRVPEARVAVRLPATLADFCRQRIRIEMGKVQLAREYPELGRRGAPQPRVRAALGSLELRDTARLGLYLAMRSAAHAVAWWRYRRGATAGIWRQAVTTKRWDAA
ncbi:MAG: glycosyltransferase family 2 protein [Deltaproteobacteria bacterium]|nr:MAG: glycosyltransferase family 2 protein [Deltaproteobacteria bacterium]